MYEAIGAWLNGEDYPELVIGDEWEFNLSENPDMPQQTNALFVSGNYLFQVIKPNILTAAGLGVRADVVGRVIGFREVSNPLPFDTKFSQSHTITIGDVFGEFNEAMNQSNETIAKAIRRAIWESQGVLDEDKEQS